MRSVLVTEAGIDGEAMTAVKEIAPGKSPGLRRMTRGSLLLTVLLLPACSSMVAEPPVEQGLEPPQLVRHSLMSPATGLQRDYFVYLPRGYAKAVDTRWPMIVFLHGHGERGDGKEELGWVMAHGPLYEAWILKRDLPFILVVPQLPMFDMKTSAPYLKFRDQSKMPRQLPGAPPERKSEFETPQPMTGAVPETKLPFGETGPPSGWPDYEHELLEMIDFVRATYRTDPDRLYLTGLSYGGYGSWYIASKHPELFAAIAPVVGWGHPDLMPPLADPPMPIWTFAGGRDGTVRTKHFFVGVNELEKLGHPDARFTIHEDMGHDVWKRVYGGQDIYDWLLLHRRKAE
jgi:predicted esterase